ncbi:MAG: hypothetical protein ACYC6N_20190 [Pirellulaceae bacterium]
MVATYDRHEIRFVYPENWTLNEEHQDADTHCVTLQSPASGFWMLQAFRPPQMPELLAAEALRSVKQEFQDVEATSVEEELEGTPTVGYDLLFYCLDFIVDSKVRSFSIDGRSFVLLWQAEDKEFDALSPVFSAITASLLNEAKRKAAMENDE